MVSDFSKLENGYVVKVFFVLLSLLTTIQLNNNIIRLKQVLKRD